MKNITARLRPGIKPRKPYGLLAYLRDHYLLYLMLIPGLFFLIVYKFLPLYGITIAFKDYSIFAGSNPIDAIAKSPWVGFKHFDRLFSSSQFVKVLLNTLIINGYKILFLFPIPIICAIMLNEIRNVAYRKLAQTAIYVPYFFSWVIVFGIFYSLLRTYGIVNSALAALGQERISFFRHECLPWLVGLHRRLEGNWMEHCHIPGSYHGH